MYGWIARSIYGGTIETHTHIIACSTYIFVDIFIFVCLWMSVCTIYSDSPTKPDPLCKSISIYHIWSAHMHEARNKKGEWGERNQRKKKKKRRRLFTAEA